MENAKIQYTTSKDYDRLYLLLKQGYLLIGFIALDIDEIVSNEYSKLVQLSYSNEYKSFDLGFTFFEIDFDKIGFVKLCKKYNIRFIDLNVLE